MNILIITYQGDITGATNSISFLAMGLAERGHQVVVGLRRESHLFKLLENSKVHREQMTFKGRLDRTNIKQIRDVILKYNIQIINAQSSRDRYTTIWAKWLYKLPVKIYHTRRQPSKSIGGLQRYFYQWGTEALIVVSYELKRIFIKDGWPENHIKVIQNGIPESRYAQWNQGRVNEIEKIINKKEGEIIIGCVSRLKRQQQLIEALTLLNDPKYRLVFVGINERDLNLAKLPPELKDRVMFIGKVPIEDSLNWYRCFDIDVLASVTDGFGLVLIESMAMGCPVIATDYAGIRDVIDHGNNGLLFPDNDIPALVSCIKSLSENNEIRSNVLEGGKHTVKNVFTIENTINGYEDFFEAELRK